MAGFSLLKEATRSFQPQVFLNIMGEDNPRCYKHSRQGKASYLLLNESPQYCFSINSEHLSQSLPRKRLNLRHSWFVGELK